MVFVVMYDDDYDVVVLVTQKVLPAIVTKVYYIDNILPLLLPLLLLSDDGVDDVDVDGVDSVRSGLLVLSASVTLTLSTRTL